MKTIFFNFSIHSVVDVITNSSTVIYTYQTGSVDPAKELVNEMLKLSGVVDKKAEDIFYFGVFCEVGHYIDCIRNKGISESINMPPLIGRYGQEDYIESTNARKEFVDNVILSVMKGEISRPSWMIDAEKSENYDEFPAEDRLVLVPREEKYLEFGLKIQKLLGSVTADGGYRG